MNKKWILSSVMLSLFLSACTATILNHSAPIGIQHRTKIAVVPFSNYTETPLAGERAKAITAGVLESRGFRHLVVYQASPKDKVLFPGMTAVESQKSLTVWAKKMHACYLMTGSVNEWTYKVGLDGEPVVGLSLQLIDLKTGHIIWTAVGSKSGGSRIAVSTTAQALVNDLLRGLY